VKFSGKVGFVVSGETAPGTGVWEDSVTERPYFGDVVRNTRRLQDGDKVLSDISVSSNSISIVADAFANETFFAIRYVWWAGTAWEVSYVDVEAPRLLLTLGGVYNGPKAPAPSSP